MKTNKPYRCSACGQFVYFDAYGNRSGCRHEAALIEWKEAHQACERWLKDKARRGEDLDQAVAAFTDTALYTVAAIQAGANKVTKTRMEECLGYLRLWQPDDFYEHRLAPTPEGGNTKL